MEGTMTREKLQQLLAEYTNGVSGSDLLQITQIEEQIWAAMKQEVPELEPEPEPVKIFSGENSRPMWEQISKLQYEK